MKILDFNKNSKQTVFSIVSLFAGAGGLDMGFANKGFDVIWANDMDKDACDTHRLWYDAGKQIGNAVPVKLAEVLAKQLHTILCENLFQLTNKRIAGGR